MISKMKKVLFIGPDSTREAMLRDLQKKGIVQIEPYRGDKVEKETFAADTSKADRLAGALKILKSHTPQTPVTEQSAATFATVEKIVSLDRQLQQLREEEKSLMTRRELIARWGEFSLDDLQYIETNASVAIQFWETQAKDAAQIESHNARSLVTLEQTAQTVLFMSIADEAITIDNCTEFRFEFDGRTLDTMLIENRQNQSHTDAELVHLNRYAKSLYHMYLAEINEINFAQALGSSVRPLGILFAFQGWVPEKQIKAVVDCAERHEGRLFEIEPDKGEQVPTMMENRGISAMGQDLVLFYDTPATSDWDPSAMIFLSFVVFFAMIMGDGGYGLTLFGLIAYMRFKNRKAKVAIKRFLNMGLILTFGTVVYGIMSGGFFGFSSQTPLVGKIIDLKIFDSGSLKKEDINFNMQLSILVGMVHISISVFLKAIRQFFQKNFMQPFANFAWIVAIWTFFFWYAGPKWGIPGQDPVQVHIMLGCAGVIFLTSAGTLHPGKLIMGGLGGLYNGVQFFSDILSYIRIFALGLSGALIAQTFNSMAGDIMGLGVWAIPLGIIIFAFGHLLNIGLCIMGAVIHGLRLNFLEYFRWSFDGGGRIFRPLEDMLEKNL